MQWNKQGSKENEAPGIDKIQHTTPWACPQTHRVIPVWNAKEAYLPEDSQYERMVNFHISMGIYKRKKGSRRPYAEVEYNQG
jgi:hypothetical protein